ncbi:hypothetical protein EDB19DRAFT_1966753 [Suillus lakei]|nr:hypothetical protein EDB19DRAFT_1966753 [Suillus lakei]
MVECPGCHRNDLSVTGLSQHLSKTKDACCNTVLTASRTNLRTLSPPPYNDVDAQNLEDGLFQPFDEEPQEPHDESSSDEENTTEEPEWEPPVQEDNGDIPGSELDDNSADRETHQHVEHQIIEQDRVLIVQYPDARAGKPIAHIEVRDVNAAYGSSINDVENPYSPFSSRMDWEITQWAKLCGPTLTAFSDLLSIGGKKLDEQWPGATVIPVVISTDKTQVMMFHNKTAYPIYLTIGNIPKEIVANHPGVLMSSSHIFPPPVWNTSPTKPHVIEAQRISIMQNAGLDGLAMRSGDGISRDYPEQVLTSAVKTTECPKCDIPPNELESSTAAFEICDLNNVLDALATIDVGDLKFIQACHDAGIKPIIHPFWERLPYTNIFQAITPDILHQLYQGLVKHLLTSAKP